MMTENLPEKPATSRYSTTLSSSSRPKIGVVRRKAGVVTVKQMRLRIVLDDPTYPGMKKIKISGKELSLLPNSLFNLSELEILDLSPEREACLYYHLKVIPDEISKLHHLKVLCIDTNKLTELPNSLCDLRNLERLALSNNLLQKLPEHFHRLESLTSLHCANNLFTHFPLAVTKLPNLTFLDFSDNQLESIPDDVGELRQLGCLNLSYNKLSIIPDRLTELSNLSMLWLCMNNITTLPKGFEQLNKLDWSWMTLSTMLDGNPLQHPPLAVAKQGLAAIEKYLSLHNLQGSNDNPSKPYENHGAKQH